MGASLLQAEKQRTLLGKEKPQHKIECPCQPVHSSTRGDSGSLSKPARAAVSAITSLPSPERTGLLSARCRASPLPAAGSLQLWGLLAMKYLNLNLQQPLLHNIYKLNERKVCSLLESVSGRRVCFLQGRKERQKLLSCSHGAPRRRWWATAFLFTLCW